MKDETLEYMLDEIYGAFGRNRPAPGSPAYRAIERRVNGNRPLPDECARYIAEAMQDYDSLPTNMGKAVLGEFMNWLSENPDKKAKEHSCPECSRGLHGFFWAWDKEGTQYVLKCACNRNDRFEKMPAFTHRKALADGLLLEGPIKAHPTQRHDVKRFLGAEKPRPDHLRQMEGDTPF